MGNSIITELRQEAAELDEFVVGLDLMAPVPNSALAVPESVITIVALPGDEEVLVSGDHLSLIPVATQMVLPF